MDGFFDLWADAAGTSTGLFWMAFWAFGLGYLISSMILVFVTRERMRAALGTPGARSVGLATFFGFVSSSCSIAALSGARALFAKGAGPGACPSADGGRGRRRGAGLAATDPKSRRLEPRRWQVRHGVVNGLERRDDRIHGGRCDRGLRAAELLPSSAISSCFQCCVSRRATMAGRWRSTFSSCFSWCSRPPRC